MAALGAALLLAACREPPGAPLPAATPSPARPASDLSGPWGEVRLARFGLVVPLPDRRGWRIDDASGPWFSAQHDEASAKLLVRSWREQERATRETCEARARTWRALPERAGARSIEKRRIDFPPDHDTVVEIAVVHEAGSTRGFALAFGAFGRRCFAFVGDTRAAGPGAERLVGDRLAAMAIALERARIESLLGPPAPSPAASPPQR